MSNFRTRLLAATALATAFAGASYGQLSCTGSTTLYNPAGVVAGAVAGGTAGLNPTLRAESQAELVADAYITGCTSAGTTGSVNVSLSLPVTSKSITTTPTTLGNSDAVLNVITGPAAFTTYYGTVVGQQVSFSGVAFPAAFSLEVSNIRVNATGGGAPQVTESVAIQFATGTTSSNVSVTPSTGLQVGYILPTLGATSLVVGNGPFATSTSYSYTTCGGDPFPFGIPAVAPSASNLSFKTNITEIIAGAFRTQVQENGSFIPVGANAAGIGLANSSDQITYTLTNVPASATVYVPQSIAVNGTTLSIANSTASTQANIVLAGNFVAYTPTSGNITVTYTVTAAANTAASTFVVPTYVSFSANAASAQGAITVQTAYAPSGPAPTGPVAAVPNFSTATGGAAVNASSVTICQTGLLFPYVTNTQGFDTGIVIADTSVDNLGTGGKSQVTAQGGTCTLSFYGATLPTPSTGVAVPGGAITAGNLATPFLLSSVAPGFQGYMIASCPFLYAHGYAFIETGLGTASGVAQGYIAEILNPNRAAGPAAEAVTF